MKKNHRLSAILVIALTLGFGFTITVVSAAPKITVTSAVPDQAEQGTTGLTVIINGRGFDNKNGMDVKFCRSGTNETCEDAGVDVKPGSVIFINSKKLEVIVDVDISANTGLVDIEAISLSSGRRGRGIEKFAVLKAGGGDATYSVVISGAVSGASGDNDWRGGFTGKSSIGLNTVLPLTAINNVGQLDLSFFTMSSDSGLGPFSGSRGLNCFGTTDVFLGQATLRKGKRGRAEGHFDFFGRTDDGMMTEVQYRLAVVGSFDGDWPPSNPLDPTDMIMDTWEMSAGESGSIQNISCEGDGDFINILNALDDEVVITVTLVE